MRGEHDEKKRGIFSLAADASLLHSVQPKRGSACSPGSGLSSDVSAWLETNGIEISEKQKE